MAGMDEKFKEEMRAAAAMAVASATVDKIVEDRKVPKQIPKKIPPPVVRSVVLVQACLRRKAFLRSFGAAALEDEELAELAPPHPLTAVALYMCRRMRNPKFVDVDTEASSVSGIVVSKSNVTMDVLAQVLWFYEGDIPDEHPAIITLREKLTGLTIEAHEVLQVKLDDCMTPAEVHAEVEHARKTFRVLPELEPQVFSCAEKRMEAVTRDAEKIMKSEISKSITTLEYDENKIFLESLFGPVETHLREELSVAHLRRVQFLEQELETRWSRPFAGPLPPHTRAAKRYTLELGRDMPKVVDFLEELKRHASVLEAQFEVKISELQALLKNLTARRKEAKARSLIQDLDSKLTGATIKLQGIIEEALVNLGPDNQKVRSKASVLLSLEAYTGVFAMFAETQAEDLRQELEANDPAPEAADRRRGIAFALSSALDALGPKHAFQTEMREEFREELEACKPTPPSSPVPQSRELIVDEPDSKPVQEEPDSKPVQDAAQSGKEDAATSGKDEAPAALPSTEPESLVRSAPDLRGCLKGLANATLSGTLPQTLEENAQKDGQQTSAPAAAASEAAAAADGVSHAALPEAWASGHVPSVGAPVAEPLSPGEATEDEPEQEDLWFTPIGFEDVKAKDDEVHAPEKFKIPGADGVPVRDAQSSIYVPDQDTVMMMQSFDTTLKEKTPAQNGVTAQLVLQDLTMDVVELHSEQVFGAKFRRAIADACGIPSERIKILGFEPGSVKVLLQIGEPTADEAPVAVANERRGRGATAGGPKTAQDVLSELEKQVADPASRLRLGEVGPFTSSAVIERGLAATTKKAQQGSLAQAYAAPPLGSQDAAASTSPGAPAVAWAAGSEAGASKGAPSADVTAYPWSTSAASPAARPTGEERLFRTSCHRDPEKEQEQAAWATPYQKQDMYAFYNKTADEVFPRALDGGAPSTKPKKEKFSMHASFCLTRHPVGGVDKFKSLPVPKEPTIAAASSWLENAEAELQDHGFHTMQSDWPEMKELSAKAKGKAGDGTDTAEDGDGEDEDSGDGKKKGRKGRKGKAKAKKNQDLAEPELEPGADLSARGSPRPDSQDSQAIRPSSSDSDVAASPASAKSKGKKGKKKGASDTPSRSKSKDVSDRELSMDDDKSPKGDEEPTSPEADRTKKKKKTASKKDKEKLKPVFEDGKDGDAKQPEPSSEGAETAAEDRAAARRARRRPADVDTQRKEGDADPKVSAKTPKAKSRERPHSEGGKDHAHFAGDLGSQNSDYAGMLGGKPHTGIRHQVDGDIGHSKDRLPELFGKKSTDDLRSPAFMYTWFRHSVVGVGPPYRTHDKESEESPIWTAMQMLDATLDKNDWHRSYGFQTRRIGKVKQEWAFRGAQLGPERSIRQISQHAMRAQSAGARDRLPPVDRRNRRQRGKKDRHAASHPVLPSADRPETPQRPETPGAEEDTIRPPSAPGGTAVADSIDLSAVTAADAATVEKHMPKKKRERIKLNEKREETEEEKKMRLQEEEAKAAAAAADVKNKAKQDKHDKRNKAAKDRIEKEKKEKAERAKQEAEEAKQIEDEIEAERLQREKERMEKDEAYRARKAKQEAEAIERNRNRGRERGERPDMSDYDPHALDEVRDAAMHDVNDPGHLEVRAPSKEKRKAHKAESAAASSLPTPTTTAAASEMSEAEQKEALVREYCINLYERGGETTLNREDMANYAVYSEFAKQQALRDRVAADIAEAAISGVIPDKLKELQNQERFAELRCEIAVRLTEDVFEGVIVQRVKEEQQKIVPSLGSAVADAIDITDAPIVPRPPEKSHSSVQQAPPEVFKAEKPVEQEAPPMVFKAEKPVQQEAPPEVFKAEKPVQQEAPPEVFKAEKPVQEEAPPEVFKAEKPVQEEAPPEVFKAEKPVQEEAPPEVFKAEKPVQEEAPPEVFKAEKPVQEEAPPEVFKAEKPVQQEAPPEVFKAEKPVQEEAPPEVFKAEKPVQQEAPSEVFKEQKPAQEEAPREDLKAVEEPADPAPSEPAFSLQLDLLADEHARPGSETPSTVHCLDTPASLASPAVSRPQTGKPVDVLEPVPDVEPAEQVETAPAETVPMQSVQTSETPSKTEQPPTSGTTVADAIDVEELAKITAAQKAEQEAKLKQESERLKAEATAAAKAEVEQAKVAAKAETDASAAQAEAAKAEVAAAKAEAAAAKAEVERLQAAAKAEADRLAAEAEAAAKAEAVAKDKANAEAAAKADAARKAAEAAAAKAEATRAAAGEAAAAKADRLVAETTKAAQAAAEAEAAKAAAEAAAAKAEAEAAKAEAAAAKAEVEHLKERTEAAAKVQEAEVAAAKAEADRKIAEAAAAAKAEADRKAAEAAAAAKAEADRKAAEDAAAKAEASRKAEAAKAEAEAKAAEAKAAADRMAAAVASNDAAAVEAAAAAKAEADRLEAEVAAAKAEADRKLAEADAAAKAQATKAEADRIAAEAAAQAEADRVVAEQAAASAKAESDRLAAEAAAKTEADREADRVAAEAEAARKEADRLAAEKEAVSKTEADRMEADAAAAKSEADRLAAEAEAARKAEAAAKEEADRLAAEAAEAAAKAEADRLAAEAEAATKTAAAAKEREDADNAAKTAAEDKAVADAQAAAKAEEHRLAALAEAEAKNEADRLAKEAEAAAAAEAAAQEEATRLMNEFVQSQQTELGITNGSYASRPDGALQPSVQSWMLPLRLLPSVPPSFDQEEETVANEAAGIYIASLTSKIADGLQQAKAPAPAVAKAPAPAVSDFRKLPSLNSVYPLLPRKEVITEQAPVAPPEVTVPDTRKLASDAFDSIYALFPQQAPLEETLMPETVVPAVLPEPVAPARLKTNVGATKEQVLNFAQSLTSSIFRNSNTLAMSRSSSQPQMSRPQMAATLPSSSTANASSSRAASAEHATQSQVMTRPVFRKKHSPIPAEDGAFFD